jgi:hypothetical protein
MAIAYDVTAPCSAGVSYSDEAPAVDQPVTMNKQDPVASSLNDSLQGIFRVIVVVSGNTDPPFQLLHPLPAVTDVQEKCRIGILLKKVLDGFFVHMIITGNNNRYTVFHDSIISNDAFS